MFGGIIAILIVYWYYRSAEARGLPNFQWAFAGLLAFYVPNIIWSVLVARPWLATLRASGHPGVMAGIVGYSSVFLGAACAVLVYRLFLLKASKPN